MQAYTVSTSFRRYHFFLYLIFMDKLVYRPGVAWKIVEDIFVVVFFSIPIHFLEAVVAAVMEGLCYEPC